VRIARLVVFGLLIAAVLSAVALAVDKQRVEHATTTKSDDDAAEVTVTVTGVLHMTADGYSVGSRAVSFGPPWYAAGASLVKDNLGKTVTVTGVADDDDLSVRAINGTVYRAKGRPPWAGGRKHTSSTAAAECKAKAKSAAKAAKHAGTDEKSAEKTDKPGGGPPSWAKAYGHRCKG
jgi:hypothetical protein